MEDEPMSVFRSAQIFRKFLYNYREQLLGSLILAGYDEKEGAQVKTLNLILNRF
jgi:20S proteasome alpha/beta subunit